MTALATIEAALVALGLEPHAASYWNGWELSECPCGHGVLLASPGDSGMPCDPADLLACLRRHGSATTWDHVWREVATCHEEAE